MRIYILSFAFVIIACTATHEANTIREPDVISQRANLKDYYAWDGKRWVWSEYLPKKNAVNKVKPRWIEEDILGIVTFGKPRIEGVKEWDQKSGTKNN